MSKTVLMIGLTLALGGCASPGSGRAPSTAPFTAIGSGRLPPAPAVDPRTVIARSATAMLGQPYRWGGAAPGGFDCSGLVVYAAAGAKIPLPRTAKEQLHIGEPIARRDVGTGDLVFMHLARKELHVGIALDGARFVHAPSAGGYVRIDSIDAPPYARGFLAARRIVDLGLPAAAPRRALPERTTDGLD